jgi:hypothetical protein
MTRRPLEPSAMADLNRRAGRRCAWRRDRAVKASAVVWSCQAGYSALALAAATRRGISGPRSGRARELAPALALAPPGLGERCYRGLVASASLVGNVRQPLR